MTTLVVIAKEPVPGQGQDAPAPAATRSSRPREIAAASLAGHARRGRAAPGRPPHPATSTASRDARRPGASRSCRSRPAASTSGSRALFDQLDEPTLLIGMDTPQLDPADLAPAVGLADTDATLLRPRRRRRLLGARPARAPRRPASAASRCRAPTPARSSSRPSSRAGLTRRAARARSRRRPRRRRLAVVAAGSRDVRLARAVAGASAQGRAA